MTVYEYIRDRAIDGWPQSPVHIGAWGNTGLCLDEVEAECERLVLTGEITEVERRVHSPEYTECLYVATERLSEKDRAYYAEVAKE